MISLKIEFPGKIGFFQQFLSIVMPNSVNARFFLAKIHLDLPSQFNKNIIIRSKNVSKGNEQVFFTFIRTGFFFLSFNSVLRAGDNLFFFDFT